MKARAGPYGSYDKSTYWLSVRAGRENVWPDVTQSKSFLSYDHRAFAYFDRNVGIYIATKLFQFASRKEPSAILAGPYGFFRPWGLFLESPETFRAHFGWHNSLCIFKMKASRGTKLCSYFDFYSLYNIWKDQLYRISRPEFYEWLFGPEKFSGLSRNWPHRAIAYGPHSAIFSIVLRAPRVMW